MANAPIKINFFIGECSPKWAIHTGPDSRSGRVQRRTNIALSALIFSNGRLAPIRQAWQQELFYPLASKETTEELIRAMSYPKLKLSSTDRDELLADYLPYCAIVKTPAKAPRVPPCRDPFDLPFLHLAVAGKAKYVVTGDLLDVRGKLAFAIVAASEFISALGF